MMRLTRTAILLLVAAPLALTGCSTPTSSAPSVTSTPTTVEQQPGCIIVTDGVRSALQDRLDAKGAGYTITAISAVLDDGGSSWWVAASADGEPVPVTAAWYTQQDPGIADDAAFLSATELASLISDSHMPEDLTGADPIEQAIDCLPQ